MTPEELRQRTTDFAAEVVKFCRQLRTQPEARGIAEQLSDSATSVAANYRSVTRARSRREFIAKLAVAVEEADETLGWLEILVRSGTVPPSQCEALSAEARELVAILSASRKTAERRRRETGEEAPGRPG